MNDRSDSQLIDDLGGPAAVAELLGFDKAKGGIQRVHNWRSRGIPAAVKVQRPDLFLAPRAAAAPDALPPAAAQNAEAVPQG